MIGEFAAPTMKTRPVPVPVVRAARPAGKLAVDAVTPVRNMRDVLTAAIASGELPDQSPDLATAVVFGVVLEPAQFAAYGWLPAEMVPLAHRLRPPPGPPSRQCERRDAHHGIAFRAAPDGSPLAPLFVTHLGAFNDNLLKASLGIFVTYRLAESTGMDAASLVMLAGGLFIAPFFLFSGASGTLADRVDKAVIARW
jgi:hypothetical protein